MLSITDKTSAANSNIDHHVQTLGFKKQCGRSQEIFENVRINLDGKLQCLTSQESDAAAKVCDRNRGAAVTYVSFVLAPVK